MKQKDANKINSILKTFVDEYNEFNKKTKKILKNEHISNFSEKHERSIAYKFNKEIEKVIKDSFFSQNLN
ncbi:hypothetical protein [Mesoplasma florum]|uniref:hypothetical protein n=1 Tax=Mesoplasma florum TaxID=2151 RepID=UPI000BE48B52|nr:hypothetical protein [Mesoplasma florum]ATI73975.1 hypothetical protein CQZ70_01770 [Mesoplasma florum]